MVTHLQNPAPVAAPSVMPSLVQFTALSSLSPQQLVHNATQAHVLLTALDFPFYTQAPRGQKLGGKEADRDWEKEVDRSPETLV